MFVNLTHFSNKELLSSAKKTRRKEHEALLEMLAHINEIDRRRLYRPQGYGSLYDYCVDELKFSPSAGFRRIRVARCLRCFPEAGDMLRRHEATLMTIYIVARVLTAANAQELLSRIQSKTQKQVEEIVAEYKPPAPTADKVRPVYTKVPAGSKAELEATAPEDCENPNYFQTGSKSAGGQPADTSNPKAPRQLDFTRPRQHQTRVEKRFEIKFLADEDFMKEYQTARALMSHKMCGSSFMQVFRATLREYVEKHSPETKQARREKKKARKKAARKPASKTKSAEPPSESTSEPSPSRSERSSGGRRRHIPAAVRDKVFVKDGGRCTYVSPNGRRCWKTQRLEVDHI